MGEVAIEQIEPAEVSDELTRYLQSIALAAWARALPERSRGEIQYRFNPDDTSHIKTVQQEYYRLAQTGGLLVAYKRAHETGLPIGYALAKSEGHASRYALMQHLAVSPDAQGGGVARQLAQEALVNFSPSQVPTAYIFQSNTSALHGIIKYGYRRVPQDRGPTIRSDFFGPRALPVYEYRFAATSVAAVLHKLRQ